MDIQDILKIYKDYKMFILIRNSKFLAIHKYDHENLGIFEDFLCKFLF